jgi:hypothetical protein
MAAVLSIIAVIILAGSLFLVGCNKLPWSNNTTCTGQEVTVQNIKSLQKCQVEDMLRKIESNPKSISVIRAGCYVWVSFDDPAEYICPVCGHKTIYDKKYYIFSNDQLNAIKRTFEEFKSKSPLEVSLDYSSLCGYCNRNAKQRGIFLEVTYGDGSKSKADIDGEQDFRAILALLEGKNAITYEGENIQEALKQKSTHLRKLLGLPKAEEKKE